MNKQLETYLSEVRTQLKSLSPEKQHEQLQEIRQHLQALLAGYVERGDAEDEAAAAAIRQFGNSKQVGRALRQAQANKEMIKSKKFFLIVFTVLHMAVAAVMLAAGSQSSFYPIPGLPVSPWMMGFYVLLTPLVSPVLWLHFNYFNSTLLYSSSSHWALYLLSLLNSFLWAWLAWRVLGSVKSRVANRKVRSL